MRPFPLFLIAFALSGCLSAPPGRRANGELHQRASGFERRGAAEARFTFFYVSNEEVTVVERDPARVATILVAIKSSSRKEGIDEPNDNVGAVLDMIRFYDRAGRELGDVRLLPGCSDHYGEDLCRLMKSYEKKAAEKATERTGQNARSQ